MKSRLQTRRASSLRVSAGLAGALLITACASTPPAPTAELAAAQSAISAAEQVDAGRHASVELDEARTKLTSANTAVQEERMDAAAQLAVQSQVAAELATAKTAQHKAKAVNEDMQRSSGVLVDEMQRSEGEKK